MNEYQLLGFEKSTYKDKTRYNLFFVSNIDPEKGSGFKPLQLFKYTQSGTRYSTFPSFENYPDLKVGSKYRIYFNQYGDVVEIVPSAAK